MDIRMEVIKAALSLTVGLVVLGTGWLVGNRLSLQWSLRQKKRELELGALNRLYGLYGEFFAVWKLWDQKWKKGSEEVIPEDHQMQLLERACAVEGQVESFLLKLTAERPLTEAQLEMLGRFRQAFQVLRERIRKNKRLHWGSSVPSEYPDYAAFKELTHRVACFLFDSPAILVRGFEPDALAVLKVTSNHWEHNWVDARTTDVLDRRYQDWRDAAPDITSA